LQRPEALGVTTADTDIAIGTDATASQALARLPCGWLSLDERSIVVSVNTALCRLLGASAEQLEGRPFDSLLSRAACVLYQSYLQPLLRLHGNTEELSLTFKCAGGGTLDMLVYTRKRSELGDALIDMVLAPIHQRRRIEDEMLRIKRAADKAPGLIFQLLQLTDGSQHFPYASEAIQRLYGITPAQAHESAEAVFSRIHPDDRVIVQRALYETERQGSDLQLIYRVHSPTGEIRWHEVQATLRRLANDVMLWHGHIADITQRQDMEVAAAKRVTIERIHLARTQMLSRISHELRTPLNGILGFAQLLANDPAEPLSPGQTRHVDVIRASGRHLLHLINQLLEVTNLESGQLPVDSQAIKLPMQLQQAQQLMQAQADAAGVLLLPLQCAPELTVMANELRLQQVLANLLSNAVRCSQSGDTVQLSAELQDQTVCIAVTDTGPGLSEEQQIELFQPFNRLGAEHTATEDTGLGLVIAKHLLVSMGGNLSVQSELGQGSMFLISLPAPPLALRLQPPPERQLVLAPLQLEKQPQIQPEAQQQQQQLLPPAPLVPPIYGKILYVEDNAINAILMEAIIGMRPGLQLSIAEDGAAALAAAQRDKPDLLLIDMHLPDMTGLDLLDALRAVNSLLEVPAVMVSAAARSEDIQRARKRGFAGYWTKPLDIDQTLLDLDKWLPSKLLG
jgi:PAS domain S-box-containing protein